jgi:hypothetical protein
MWLFGKYKDLGILFLPVWMIWVILFLLPGSVLHAPISLWIWVVIIMGIDVSHVWSTIFRTYLDKEEFQNHKKILILAPLLALVLLFPFAQESTQYFWRVLAYLAVFHFMKQQYGFFAIYSYKAKHPKKHSWFKDQWVLYLSMLYPVLYWHLNDRSFEWFIENDFISIPWVMSSSVHYSLEVLYWGVITGWFAEELLYVKKGYNKLSYGRILWLGTTILNWYLGIVWFNSDLAFTLTNVVAHGIPYFALVLFYKVKKQQIQNVIKSKTTLSIAVTIIGLSLVLAGLEEYLWDLFLNHEKEAFFSQIMAYPDFDLYGSHLETIALVLLSLPQVTHYILDGFIWKMNASNPYLKQIINANHE